MPKKRPLLKVPILLLEHPEDFMIIWSEETYGLILLNVWFSMRPTVCLIWDLLNRLMLLQNRFLKLVKPLCYQRLLLLR